MARRRCQQGSIRREGTRRPKWVLIYREDVVQPDGTLARPQRKVELGFLDEVPTKRLARRRADQVLQAVGINAMDYRPGRIATLGEFAERWKRDVMVHLKEGTQEKARQHLSAHLLPAFEARVLDQIGQEDVQHLVTLLFEEHLRATWTQNDAGLVFATQTGRPLSHTKILEDHLWPLLRDLRIEKRGLHSFRHTTTSILIEASVPLPLVREIVGHASVSTTLGIYGNVLRPEHREAMEKVGQILLPDVTEFGGNSLTVQ